MFSCSVVLRQHVCITALLTLYYNYLIGCKTLFCLYILGRIHNCLFTSLYRSGLAHNLYIFVEWMNEWSIKFSHCSGPTSCLQIQGYHQVLSGSLLLPWDTLVSFFIVDQVCAVCKSGLILYERITFDYHCKHSSQCLVPRNSWISLFLLFEASSTTRK